jgi:hypothetical protein
MMIKDTSLTSMRRFVDCSDAIVHMFCPFAAAFAFVCMLGVTRKIRMTTLTRERVLNTFKHKVRA